LKWEGAKGEGLCNYRPAIADTTVSDPEVSAVLDALALRVSADGIYGVTVPARCLSDRRHPRNRCDQLVNVQELAKETSAAVLAGIEDDWRQRHADGIALDKSFKFRLFLRVIISTIFFAALPWLLPAVWAEFTRIRIVTCLGMSALLGGMKLAVGVWFPALILGCLVMSLWLPGLLKRRKPWSLSLTLAHMLAVILQLSFALWHLVAGSEGYVIGAPYPEFLDLPSKVCTFVLLVAATASAGYVAISLKKAVIRVLKNYPRAASG
jgi:hypothetical protein